MRIALNNSSECRFFLGFLPQIVTESLDYVGRVAENRTWRKNLLPRVGLTSESTGSKLWIYNKEWLNRLSFASRYGSCPHGEVG